MNVQEVFDRVRRTFGDEGSVQITDQDLFRWVNDAQLQITVDNESLMEAIGTTDIVAGQAEYAVPTDMSTLHSLTYKGFRLRSLSMAEFNEYLDGYSAKTNNPFGNGVPEVFMVYANNITLFPTPNETITGGLKVYYAKHPATVVTFADPLTVPTRYHNAVVDYCLQQAYELDEDLEKASYKKGSFDETIMRNRGQEKWAAQQYYPTITTLPEDENFGAYGNWGGVI